jgi:hypothetical protein
MVPHEHGLGEKPTARHSEAEHLIAAAPSQKTVRKAEEPAPPKSPAATHLRNYSSQAPFVLASRSGAAPSLRSASPRLGFGRFGMDESRRRAEDLNKRILVTARANLSTARKGDRELVQAPWRRGKSLENNVNPSKNSLPYPQSRTPQARCGHDRQETLSIPHRYQTRLRCHPWLLLPFVPCEQSACKAHRSNRAGPKRWCNSLARCGERCRRSGKGRQNGAEHSLEGTQPSLVARLPNVATHPRMIVPRVHLPDSIKTPPVRLRSGSGLRRPHFRKQHPPAPRSSSAAGSPARSSCAGAAISA